MELLSNARRRHVLEILLEREDAIDVSKLAERVAARERGPEETAGDERREKVLISLHHVHLPKLAASGVIRRNDATGTVTFTGDAERLQSFPGISDELTAT